MTEDTDEKVKEMLVAAYLAGKDVEDPGRVRRRTARNVAERILDRYGGEADDR